MSAVLLEPLAGGAENAGDVTPVSRSAPWPRCLPRTSLCSGLAALCALLLASGCALLSPPEPVGFRSYVLRDVSLDEACALVREVTRREANDLFGGVGITWDGRLRNLSLDPIYAGSRRMSLFVHLEADGPDVDVQLFALVETLQPGAAPAWGQPQQDVPLEERLYRAYVAELLARRQQGR